MASALTIRSRRGADLPPAIMLPPRPPMPGFEWVGDHSIKLRCTVCGRRGYPWPGWMNGAAPGQQWWANTCRRGHLPAPCCGKLLAVLRNGNARRHTRACPTR